MNGYCYQMIRYNVDHEIHSAVMKGSRKILQVLSGAIIWIERVAVDIRSQLVHENRDLGKKKKEGTSSSSSVRHSHILLPVTVIACPVSGVQRQLLRHGSNPDSRESHSLNVIQLYRNVRKWFSVKDVLLTWLIIPCQEPPQYFYSQVSRLAVSTRTVRREQTRALVSHGAVVELSVRPNRSVSRK